MAAWNGTEWTCRGIMVWNGTWLMDYEHYGTLQPCRGGIGPTRYIITETHTAAFLTASLCSKRRTRCSWSWKANKNGHPLSARHPSRLQQCSRTAGLIRITTSQPWTPPTPGVLPVPPVESSFFFFHGPGQRESGPRKEPGQRERDPFDRHKETEPLSFFLPHAQK